MQVTATNDIQDATDHCRACDGNGGRYERTGRGTMMFEDCYYCRGSGVRTVRVDRKAGAA